MAAASSGLLMSMLATPAQAAGQFEALPAVDATSLATQARTVLKTSPVVSVPIDAEWEFDLVEITYEEPPPVVVEAPARTAAVATSRSEIRQPVAGASVPPSVSGSSVLEIAARYVGTPYRSGGATPDGFDCSGFVSYVYGQLGISLPRSSGAYRNIGVQVSAADAQPGDIIYSPGHVGIYAGDGLQIDSPRPGKTIQFRGIWQSNPIYIRVS